MANLSHALADFRQPIFRAPVSRRMAAQGARPSAGARPYKAWRGFLCPAGGWSDQSCFQRHKNSGGPGWADGIIAGEWDETARKHGPVW